MPKRCRNAAPFAAAEKLQVDARGNRRHRRRHAALAEAARPRSRSGRSRACTGCSIRCHLDREPLERLRVERHVMRVLLVHRVMREHQRQPPRPRQPQRGSPSRNGWWLCRTSGRNSSTKSAISPGCGNAHGKIAAVEILDRRRPQHASARFRPHLRTAGRRSAPRARGGRTPPRTCSPTRHAAHVRQVRVGEHHDFHERRYSFTADDVGRSRAARSPTLRLARQARASVRLVALQRNRRAAIGIHNRRETRAPRHRPAAARLANGRRPTAAGSPAGRTIRTVTGPHGVERRPEANVLVRFKPFANSPEPTISRSPSSRTKHLRIIITHSAAAQPCWPSPMQPPPRVRMNRLGPLARWATPAGRPSSIKSR